MVRIVESPGHAARKSRVVISTADVWYPVPVLAPRGRLRCFGGPSLPGVYMAMVRVNQALGMMGLAAVGVLPALVEEGYDDGGD